MGKEESSDARPQTGLQAGEPRASEETSPSGNLPRAFHLELPVIAVLAEKVMTLEEVLGLSKSSIISFEKNHKEPLDIYVNNCRIASGTAIKVEDRFGVHIGEIGTAEETIQKLG